MRKNIIVCFLCLTLTGCLPVINVSKFNHSPAMASEAARKFAQTAFVDKDFNSADDLLSESGKQYGTVEQFREFIEQKHPLGFPISVKVTDYAPVPRKNRIVIFADGENGEEKFYYGIPMEGIKETGYKVSGFDRSNEPYPQSDQRRPLSH
jgi:hypothetical protein